MNTRRFFALFVISLFLLACSKEEDTADPAATPSFNYADLVLLNGYVYTVDSEQTVSQAVAITNGLIAAVGSDEEVQALEGPETRIVDLAGRMLLPGLHDSHIHVFGIVEPDVCSLRSEVMSLQEMVPYLQECVQRYQLAPGEWLPVEMWNFAEGNQVSNELPNLRAALDAVSTEHPIILWGNDGHHGAVNSRALELARDNQGNVVGLSVETLSTVFSDYREVVGVDDNGVPNGELNEHARGLIGSGPRRDPAKLASLLPRIGEELARNGITSVQDAALDPAFLPYLKKFESSGDMNFRLQVANRLDPADFTDTLTGQVDLDTMMQELEKARNAFSDSDLIHPRAVKIFADGVLEGNALADPPTLPNAAVLKAYKQPRFRYDPVAGSVDVVGYVDTASPACEEVREQQERYADRNAREAFRAEHGFHPKQCTISYGVMADAESFMMQYVRRLHEAGFTIHVHVIGDRAARAAVDALEQVIPPGSGNPQRHTMAHLQLVHPDDQKRIGEMRIYLAWTYAWMLTQPGYDSMVLPFLDDVSTPENFYNLENYAMQNSYPTRGTLLAGAVPVAGSDAPVDSRSPRPFINMAVGVTRMGPEGVALNAGEALNIHEMIRAYTISGAHALNQETIAGSIEPGKKADLVVLDRNLVELYDNNQAAEIAETQVDMTFFEGQLIYLRN